MGNLAFFFLFRAIGLCLLMSLLACSDSSNSGSPTTEPSIVFLAGTVTDGTDPLADVLVTVFDGDDQPLTNSTTGPNGYYEFALPRDSVVYLQFTRQGLSPTQSQVYTLAQDITGLIFDLLARALVEEIIDRVFEGLILDLADGGWLAINVQDLFGNNIDGVTIKTKPTPILGGTLKCNGTLTGSNITSAPPCRPARVGPMYLAYFDGRADGRPVGVKFTLGDDQIVYTARVRPGRLTQVNALYFDLDSAPTPIPKGLLSITVEQGGRITTQPNVLQCNGNTSGFGTTVCETRVAHGTSIRVRAVPNPGWKFDDWDGCDVETSQNGTPTCIKTVTVQAQALIKAEFDPR